MSYIVLQVLVLIGENFNGYGQSRITEHLSLDLGKRYESRIKESVIVNVL